MTRDEILNMQAGREMDALIAQRIFGAEILGQMPGITVYKFPDNDDRIAPNYSTDISAAWQVVEKLAYQVSESSTPEWDEHPFELVKNYVFKHYWTANFNDYQYTAQAETAPLAICRAALLAVMENK